MNDFLLIILACSTGLQLCFWLVAARKLVKHSCNSKENASNSVTVVIAARNEAKNLPQLIKSLKRQQYAGTYEVIVVNDRSTDNTLDYLQNEQKKFSQLKIISIQELPKGWDGKKFALTKGIEQAKGEILLLTDADCFTASNHWIQEITNTFNPKTEVVLGVGQYIAEKGFLNTFIQFETLLTATQYLSFALTGVPYMAVGRNLAYRKASFLRVGYDSLKSQIGGDDDLMINRLATKENTEIVWSESSQTISNPKRTFKSWYLQKVRHLSASKHYSGKNKFFLGTLVFSQILFWLIFITLIIQVQHLYLVLILFFLRIISLNLIMKLIAQKLKFDINSKLFFILDFIHTLYLVIIGVVSWFAKNTKWS